MTIAITFEVFLPILNGVITSTINLAENLIKKGHKVIFLVPSWKAFNKPEINGIKIFYIPSLPTYMYPGIRLVLPWEKTAERIMIEQEVDILQITGPWMVSWHAMKAAKKSNIPVIHVFHTLIYEDTYIYYGIRNHFLIPVIRVLLWKYIGMFIKKSTVVTAPSNHACKVLETRFPETRVLHLRNGIDLKSFQEHDSYTALTSEYPDFNKKTFLFIGRLGEEKSVSLLLEAFKDAVSKDKEIKLFIVGDGPGKKDYVQTVHRNSLEKSIVFLGTLPHEKLIKSGLIHHSRAMVTASTTENQPVTIIEAIACGTPIIIPDAGAITELLHGNGTLFTPDNALSFSNKIVELANDDNLYRKFREKGESLKPVFDGLMVADAFETLYKNAIANMMVYRLPEKRKYSRYPSS